MIKVFCEICGDEMATFEKIADMPDDNIIERDDIFETIYKCEKCRKILNEMLIKEVIRAKIIDMRKDIPKETQICPKCGEHL